MHRQSLSKREAEVLDYAAEGLSDAEIAVRMKVSITTVRGYWLRIRSKMGYGSRAELTASSERAKGEELRATITERARLALEKAREGENEARDHARQQVKDILQAERVEIDKLLNGRLSATERTQLDNLRSLSDHNLTNGYTTSDQQLGSERETADGVLD